MQGVALVLVTIAGVWLIGIALLMAIRPSYCLHLLHVMRARLEASDWRLQLAEQTMRIVAGAALIISAPASRSPALLSVFGWMIVVSSVLILMLPIRWHGAFGS